MRKRFTVEGETMQQMPKWLGMLSAGAAAGVLAACAAPNPVQQTVRSTTGATLVRVGTVIDVRELTQAAPSSGKSTAVGKADSALPTRQRVRVRFEDGSASDYETDTSANFQIGERILVSNTHGNIRLSH